ncbi:MAG: sensor histidine kinase [Chitinophagaceae bacterium]
MVTYLHNKITPLVSDHAPSFFEQELHDNIGQLLTSVKIYLGLAVQEMEEVPAPLKAANEAISHALKEVRLLLKSCRSDWLTQFSLQQYLEEEVERITSSGALKVTLDIADISLTFGAAEQFQLFRIIQEALQNCMKHSSATHVYLMISLFTDSIRLTVSDNGKGFDADCSVPRGMGLSNMHRRAQFLKGQICILSSKEGGTVLTVSIPVKTI